MSSSNKKLTFFLLSIFTLFILNFIHAKEKIEYLLPEEYKINGNELEIVFIDVGQGDCILIITPSKKKILVDAGGLPYWSEITSWEPGENVVVHYLTSRNINTLDFAIISHPHSDHFGGMFAVINSLDVKEFVDNGYYYVADPNYKDLLLLIDKKGIPYEQFKEGDFFEVDRDIFVKVFFPPKREFLFETANNSSLVFKIMYKNFSVLLTGDIEKEAEEYICSKYKKELKSTVLKVPHHGSRTSSTTKFIKLVSPEIAVVMCGKNNVFGHPHDEIISKYKKYKVAIYRTDINGNIRILTDGEKYTIIPDTEQ